MSAVSNRSSAVVAVAVAGLAGGWLGAGVRRGAGVENGGESDLRPAVQQATAPVGSRAVSGTALESGIRRLLAESDGFASVRIGDLLRRHGLAGTAALPGLLETFSREEDATRALLEAWTELDPAAALAWVTAAGIRRERWEETVVKRWAGAEPDAAWAWVLAQPLRADTWKTRAGLVEAAAEKDPAGTLERMREAGWLSTQRSALIRLFRTWASRDPFAALETAVSTVKGLTAGDSDRERDLLRRVLTGLAGGVSLTESAEVVRFAGRLREAGVGSAAGEVLAGCPDAVRASAAEWLSLPGGEQMLGGWAEHAGSSAMDVFLDLPEGAQKQNLVRGVGPLGRVAAESVARLAELVRSNPAGYADVAGHMAEDLAESRPAEAVAVWSALPESQQQVSLEFFFRFLGKSDSTAAADCLAALDDAGQVRAMPRYCEGLAAVNPEAAWEAAIVQTDPVVRAESAAMTLAVWFHQDEPSALARFETAAADLDLKAFLAALPKTGRIGIPTRSVSYGYGGAPAPLQKRAEELLAAQSVPP